MTTKSNITVDLRSDTVTKPTESMKKAMITASLGDDVYGEDPTVHTLQVRVANLLGKEAALFVPSGTMANLIAAMVHCNHRIRTNCNKRGSELLCGDQSHVYKREGGIAHLAGVQMAPLQNLADGAFDLEEFKKHVQGSDIHEPITTMVFTENTHSYCGGKVLSLDWMEELASISKSYSVLVHMDGARLFNAAEYLRVTPARIARDCDSVSVCFSKGLGAPVGSALAGSRKFIEQARRYRKMLGGGMRQVGVLAGAAIVALEESMSSLSADHAKAKFLAEEIQNLKIPDFYVDIKNQHTNIVHVKICDSLNVSSKKIIERLKSVSESETNGHCTTQGLGIVVLGNAKPDSKTIKFVLHHDITVEDVGFAVKKIVFVLKEIYRNVSSQE